MKRILTLILILAGLVALTGLTVSPTYAQAIITTTSLSAAVANSRTATLTVTSATGFTASTFPGNLYYAYVDHESMLIRAVSGTTITVDRGVNGTFATIHASGALIFAGAAGSNNYNNNGQIFVQGGPFVFSSPYGGCTRAGNATLPVINTTDGTFHNCLGGQWMVQTNPADSSAMPLNLACTVPIGSVALGSLGTNTTDIADKMMRSSLWVPQTQWVTGISVLQGATATTDKITAALFDAGGRLIVSGAAAGTSLATADTFKAIAFALNANGGTQTKTLVTGPALYWVGVTGNGTAAGAYRTVATVTFNQVLTGSATSQTFGTFPSFTPATTFTADVGVITCLYN